MWVVGPNAWLVAGLELLHVRVELDKQVLLGDAHVSRQVLTEAVTHGPPAEPASVLGDVVERHAQLAPVAQLEGDVVEARRRARDERDRVVVSVDVKPGAG